MELGNAGRRQWKGGQSHGHEVAHDCSRFSDASVTRSVSVRCAAASRKRGLTRDIDAASAAVYSRNHLHATDGYWEYSRFECLSGRHSQVASRNDVRASIARGLAFLEGVQRPNGSFPTYMSLDRAMQGDCAPDPSVFPMALIAYSLGFVPGAAELRDRALDFLLREMDGSGLCRYWSRDHSYPHNLPPDLDDTCVASAVLMRAGRRHPENRPIVLANRDARGLFFTWITPRPRWASGWAYWRIALPQLLKPRALYFFLRQSASPFDVDAVVNANVLFYLGDRAETRPVVTWLLTILREGRERECDKWYESPAAIWYFFSRALSAVVPDARQLVLDRVAGARPESPLDTALAACSLLAWDEQPSDAAVAELVDAQLDSGGWPRAGLYAGGRTRRPDGSVAPSASDMLWWGSEALTTGFAVEALARLDAAWSCRR